MSTYLHSNPTIGHVFTYMVTATDSGPGAAAGLDLSLVLPAAVIHVGNSCGASVAGDTLSWTVAALANGAATDCQIDVFAVTSGPSVPRH